MEKNLIRKHNDIIEACYKMTVPELRLVYSCISKIEFKQIIDKEEPFYISAMEYSKTFGVDPKNSHREIRKAVNSIWDRELIIKRKNKKSLRCRWVSAEAEYGDGGAEIHFASEIIPYLISLQKEGNFTIYELKNIGKLKSIYSIRLYELLVQYKKIGYRKIELQELREILCLVTKYKAMCDFRKRILDVAKKEINAETDLDITYSNVKKGRSIFALHFIIKNKKTEIMAQKNNKKWLSVDDCYKEFQKKKYQYCKNYEEAFNLLSDDGYSFDKKAYYAKFPT